MQACITFIALATAVNCLKGLEVVNWKQSSFFEFTYDLISTELPRNTLLRNLNILLAFLL